MDYPVSQFQVSGVLIGGCAAVFVITGVFVLTDLSPVVCCHHTGGGRHGVRGVEIVQVSWSHVLSMVQVGEGTGMLDTPILET